VHHSRRSLKKIKPLILAVQGISKSSILIELKSSSLVFVVIGSMSMPICNRFHTGLANSGKITTFRGYRSLMSSCAGFLEPKRSRLVPLKSTFNAENFVCSLSLVILTQFALKMCLGAQNRQNPIKTLYFGVQCHIRLLLLVPIESPCTTSY